MKQILVDKNFNLYKKGDSPEELADKVLSAFLGRKVLKSDFKRIWCKLFIFRF